MWLSSARRTRGSSGGASVGRATLEGDPAGAYLDGERRALPVFAPGGYFWRPALGQKVLVLKGDGPGEPSCVAGVRAEGGVSEPGEVLLRAGTGRTAVRLRNNGCLELRGTILINGILLEDLIRNGG